MRTAWAGLGLAVALGCGGQALAPAGHGPAAASAEDLARFCETYATCRDRFRAAVSAHGEEIDGFEQWSAKVAAKGTEPEDQELTTDFAFFPAKDAPATGGKLLVLTSGIHGIEGFTGSTLQNLFLDTMLDDTRSQGVSVLLVHGVNAYGFAHAFRYTEDRVDLNRNWFAGDAFPKDLDDSLYDKYADFLNPEKKAHFNDLDFAGFVTVNLLPRLRDVQSGTLTRAVGQGQFRYEHGVEFGGKAFQPHRQTFLDNTKPYLDRFTDVLMIDLHTGLGRREMQLLPNAPTRSEVSERRKAIFEVDGHTIEATGNATFYDSFGDFSDFVCDEVYTRPGHRCVNMLLEYGTLLETTWDTWPLGLGAIPQNIAGAFTLYVSVRENQIARFGAVTSRDETRFAESYRELFYPTDPKWRATVLDQSSQSWPKFIENFVASK
jgi:hypothetical protein